MARSEFTTISINCLIIRLRKHERPAREVFKAFDKFCFGGSTCRSILYRAALLNLFRHTDHLVNFFRSRTTKVVEGQGGLRGRQNCQFTPQNFSGQPSSSIYSTNFYLSTHISE